MKTQTTGLTEMPPEWLTQRKAQHRVEIRRRVAELAAEFGYALDAERSHEDETEMIVYLKTERGLCAVFDMSSAPSRLPRDTFFVSWFAEVGATWKLSPDFWTDLNTYHFRKATQIRQGVDQLLDALRHAFGGIKSGEAFQPESIAKATHA